MFAAGAIFFKKQKLRTCPPKVFFTCIPKRKNSSSAKIRINDQPLVHRQYKRIQSRTTPTHDALHIPAHLASNTRTTPKEPGPKEPGVRAPHLVTRVGKIHGGAVRRPGPRRARACGRVLERGQPACVHHLGLAKQREPGRWHPHGDQGPGLQHKHRR